MEVQGVTNVTVSALSPTGERFKAKTSAYVVDNVDEVDLSLEVMMGLRIVDDQFPTAGAGNQHGTQKGAWDKTGTIAERLRTPRTVSESTSPAGSLNVPANTYGLSSLMTSSRRGTRSRLPGVKRRRVRVSRSTTARTTAVGMPPRRQLRAGHPRNVRTEAQRCQGAPRPRWRGTRHPPDTSTRTSLVTEA